MCDRSNRAVKVLVVATDAFGGRGGIARYTRDLLLAFCAYREGQCQVVAVPRSMVDSPGTLPPNLRYITGGAGGRGRFAAAVFAALFRARRFDVVLCGHILLLPLAWLAARLSRCRCVLFIYGIDAWQPTRSRLKNRLAKRVDSVVSITHVTAQRFRAWSGMPESCVHLLPPCIDPEQFTPGPPDQELLQRYGLTGRTVLMTLARLDASERYKGIDEVLEQIPHLVDEFPNLSYLIVGDGNDRPRLQEKARQLGIAARVVFTAWIEDAEKLEHYRLAHAFAMPGRGEGFGIVYLEAMACGVPVLASALDGSREAVGEGELGLLVDPMDRDALRQALSEVLRQPRGNVPQGLSVFFRESFQERVHRILDQELSTCAAALRTGEPDAAGGKGR